MDPSLKTLQTTCKRSLFSLSAKSVYLENNCTWHISVCSFVQERHWSFLSFRFFFHFCIVVALLLAAVKVLKSNFNFSLPPFLFLVHLSLCLSFSYSLSGIPLFTYAREEGQWQKGVNNACHSAFYQPGLMEKLKVNATTSLVAQLQLIDGSVSSCQPMNWIWMQSCTVKLSWT